MFRPLQCAICSRLIKDSILAFHACCSFNQGALMET